MSVLQVGESYSSTRSTKCWVAMSEKVKIDFEEMNKL